MNIDQGTVTGLVTLGVLLAIVYCWRKFGFLGGLAAAVIACIVAGSYASPVRSFLTSGSRLWEAPAEAIRNLIS